MIAVVIVSGTDKSELHVILRLSRMNQALHARAAEGGGAGRPKAPPRRVDRS